MNPRRNFTQGLQKIIGMVVILSILCSFALPADKAQAAPEAIPLSKLIPYTENFDSIGTSATATLPTDWRVSKNTTLRTVDAFPSTNVTERLGGNNMASDAANGIYNFGAGVPDSAADRAVGFLSSSSATKSGNLYVHFYNATIVNLSGVTISYDIEKYRTGTNSAGFSVQLYYSFDGTTWTSAGSNFLTSFPADASTSGYPSAPGVTVSVANQILTVDIPSGSDFYLAWNYSVTSGTTTSYAQALGVDNFSIVGNGDEHTGLVIYKSAPSQVNISDTYTYTLSVANDTGITTDQVVITDSLPISLTVISISDGGELMAGNIVSWTVPSILDSAAIYRTVSVSTTITGTMLNHDYGVHASNWITFTMGNPVTTTVIDPYAATPIAVARAAGVGWTGSLRGNVTVPPDIFRSNVFVIQDDTGGMYIYDYLYRDLPPMDLGDDVLINGTIKDYNGLLEIDPLSTVTWIGPGTPPAPLITDTAHIASTQGWLIQVIGTATWSGTPPAPGTDWEFTINDGSGPVAVFVDKDTGIDMRGFSSGSLLRITGFSGNYYDAQLMPRFQIDIIDITPPAVNATYPLNGATDVSLYYPLTATFTKPMAASTITTSTFTLQDSIGLISGTVSYNAGIKTTTFTPDAPLDPLTEYTATLTTDIEDTSGIPLETPYIWSFTTGEEDITIPAISGQSPAPSEVDVALTTNVVITFTEDLHPSSLIPINFTLNSPYGAVPNTLSYNASTFAVTINPDARLLPTTIYTITVYSTTTDWAGNSMVADEVWTFETSIEPPMSVYFGDIHNHTSYSDGSGYPDQALAAGEAAGFDFMAITDHSYAIDDPEWEDTLTAVEAATDSDFVALRGFEYTQGAEGHINVYNTVRHAVRTDTGCSYCDYTPNLEAGVTVQGFYEWLDITGTVGLDEAGTIMQFNHPGWINFNDWTYHPEVSDVARLEEVGNGYGTSYVFSEDEYIRSLDYGWKVGATNNADTHSLYWGTNTDHRTGVLMPELTKEALLEALRERRTFATEDKNFSLWMKANGAWMGSEIANPGYIQFEITGSDPDGELTILVEIITDQGTVAESYVPSLADFNWSPLLTITTGVHYFYIKVTQADGDRIVSSPIWTLGDEDIAITDVVIQPTIPTIHSPSLLTARVTNRVEEARTVTVTLDVDGVYLTPEVVVIVPANGDAYANFSWHPIITGAVTVTAHIIGAPLADNPDDNEGILNLTVTDEQLPLILIDAGHGNTNALGREMRMFIADLSDHQYNVLKNLDELTAGDLDPDVVKLLIITAPEFAYTSAELAAIGDYVAAGGSLWLCGLADYTGKVSWANTVAGRLNDILTAVEVETGQVVNMRMNDDEVIDGNTNNGYVFGVIWGDFPSEDTTSIGINVDAIASWSLNSIRGRSNEPLTSSTPGVQIIVQGDLDVGYTSDYWHNPYHTSNTDADGSGDAYIYNPTWFYPATPPPNPIPLPMAAVTDLPGDAGSIMLYGDSNDPFTTFAYTAGDGKQNELFNLQTVMWLLGEPLQKSDIAEARAQSQVNQPDNLDRLVWIEGTITAAYGEFFNVLYVQDDTGGITVHAPAGDIDPTEYTRGTVVRVVGTVGIYNGDTEIEFFEAEMVQVLDPGTGEPLPMPMSSNQASLEENQGWLAVITGTVTAKTGLDTLMVDDGSGPVRIFLDGYNGDFSDIQINDLVRVTGLVSEDGDGPRIRVRNYQMHPKYTDDVIILDQVLELAIAKSVSAPEIILPGSLVTYTIVLSNTGTGTALQVALTDTLPDSITFGAFLASDGASEQDGTISWAGNVSVDENVEVIFTATVDSDNLYGETITNTVEYNSIAAGSGYDDAAFVVGKAANLSIKKNVALSNDPALPGDVITYTITITNSGDETAFEVRITDTLPAELVGMGVDETVDIPGNSIYENVFTATINADVYGAVVLNTAHFEYALGSDSSQVIFYMVGAPVLVIEKTVETANTPARFGDVVTYTIEVSNDGVADAPDVHVIDMLPDGLVGDDVDEIVDITPGNAYVLVFTATVGLDATPGAEIVNTAAFEWGEVTGSAEATFTVIQRYYLPFVINFQT
ncbi:MAG: DUF11 domain-containing protein [Anaerolineales bacterium]|nr:DUF11 domain-containing protein [Anaerolineales bacterium]